MTSPKGDPAQEPAPERAESKKKRYEKPQFIREQLFETMALACGKASPAAQCQTVKKNS